MNYCSQEGLILQFEQEQKQERGFQVKKIVSRLEEQKSPNISADFDLMETPLNCGSEALLPG